MEFWLTYNNRAEVLQLPVPPPEFNIQEGNNITTVNINTFGEIALIGKPKLVAIELSTFFPAQQYSFCQYSGFPDPYECVKMIRRWRNTGRPIRLIITGTDINMPCCIEDFRYGEKDASGDVYFTLSLKEYRFIQTSKTMISSQSNSKNNPRPADKATSKTYTVKQGDTLWMIAKKVYGDGDKYKTLASKNNIKDVKSIRVGQVLIV